MKTPQVQNIANKTVIVRVDYNVPLSMSKNGKITVSDDKRIQLSLKTLDFLIKNKAKIILISHLGRPTGSKTGLQKSKDKNLSLKPVADHLKHQLNYPVTFIPDTIGDEVQKQVDELQAGEILMLENLRFYTQEKQADQKFAKEIAKLGQVYINEAFSNCHRNHASMVNLAKLLPSFIGFNVKKELQYLTQLLENPKKPFVVIVGGAKISDKVGALQNLTQIADLILVGGGVANNFLKAQGIETHHSYLQDKPSDKKKENINYVEVAENLLKSAKTEKILKDGYIPLPKIIYPIDVLAGKNLKSTHSKLINLTHNIKDTDDDKDLMYLDIGPKTIKLYQELLLQAGTIFWNGPMGVFENKKFSTGTKEIARTIAKSSALTILGGGDTIAAINHFNLSNRYDYISSAGGASLEFLAGKKLPALEAIK